MKLALAIFALSSATFWIGCRATPPPVQPSPDFARFQLVGSAYLYALDTKTGQLCRTFNERPDIHVPKGLALDGKPIDNIPLCIDLTQSEAATIRSLRGQ